MHNSSRNHALQRLTAARRSPQVKIAPARLCLVAVFVIPCLQASAIELSPMPQRFSAHIGGLMGASYSVELHDGCLLIPSLESGASMLNKRRLLPPKRSGGSFARHSTISGFGSGGQTIQPTASSTARSGRSTSPTRITYCTPMATTTILTILANRTANQSPHRCSTNTLWLSRNYWGIRPFDDDNRNV